MTTTTTTTEPPLLIRREGRTCILTLNRPAARNALSEPLLRQLAVALETAREDTDLRAIVITGAGDRAFCAGADIKHMQGLSLDEAREWALLGQSVLSKLAALPLPVIAALNGVAVGGGCELALACDFRYAAETAQIGQPEIRLGTLPGWGGTQRLTRLVGPAIAKDLIFTGRTIPAHQAHRLGLVDVVAPAAALLDQALTAASQYDTLPPRAVAHAKHAINAAQDLPLHDGLLLEAELFARSFATHDRAEGMAAFLEKRPPQFTGH